VPQSVNSVALMKIGLAYNHEKIALKENISIGGYALIYKGFGGQCIRERCCGMGLHACITHNVRRTDTVGKFGI
jgi:hypothetical protein